MSTRTESIESVETTLASLVGDEVTVCVSSIYGHRKGFHTQMSVRGKLETKERRVSADDYPFPVKAYRVVTTDHTFVYFTSADIATSTPTACGPVIFITVEVDSAATIRSACDRDAGEVA